MAEKTKAQKQARQFGNLELRADLEPYLAKNPLARLGYDIITRGENVGEGPGGEMVAGIMGGPEGFDKYGITKSYYGIMLPSRTYNTPEDTDVGYRFVDTETFFSPLRDPYTAQVLKKQGIMKLLPPEEGSTVYYDTGDESQERGMDLNTLMEELAHVGMREIQKRGNMKDVSLSTEEYLMNVLQGRSSESGGTTTKDQRRAFSRQPNYMKDLLEESDRLSSEILMARGVPPRAAQRERSFFNKISDIFN